MGTVVYIQTRTKTKTGEQIGWALARVDREFDPGVEIAFQKASVAWVRQTKEFGHSVNCPRLLILL